MDQPHFTFSVEGLAQDAFHVVRFSGTEGLSRLYQFELTLLTTDTDLDFEKALYAPAVFTIQRGPADPLLWHGILKDITLVQTLKARAIYKASLVPRAWIATQTFHNRIFLDQDLAQNLRDCLTDAGLSNGLDFELRASASYPKREYVCQYNESHMAFVNRWCERNGLYYYFDQTGPREKMIFTDSRNIHGPHPAGADLLYAETSGLDAPVTGQALKNFQCEAKRLPAKVLVKDYNYRTPGLDVRGEAAVSPRGLGQVYVHGGHMRSVRQANFLAQVRAQSLGCREKVYLGETNAPFVQPGYLMDVSNHPRKDFGGSFLAIEVRHEGAQESWLTSGLGQSGLGERLFYRNGFAAIPAEVQYRGEIKTPRPFIHGFVSAVVDAEGSGQYAELDEQGRYKVIMPFDISGRKDGHASTWLRMAQPYAGDGHGMHLPLHKGAEVMVVFYEGDPDRPMIAGAVPNQRTASPVTADNQTMANITTAGGNRIHMQDLEGSQRILLHSAPTGDFIRIGHPNDPSGAPMSGQDARSGGGPGGHGVNPADGSGTAPPPGQGGGTGGHGGEGGAGASGGSDGKKGDSGHDGKKSESGHGEAAHEGGGEGIQLWANKWFKVNAGEVGELILGSKTEFVGGSDLKTVVGVETGVTLGLKSDFVLGGEIQVHAPHSLIYSTSKQHMKAYVDNIVATQNDVIAEHTKVIARRTKAIASLTDTVASQQKMVGTLNKVVGEHSRTIASLEEDVADYNGVFGEIDRVVGNIVDTMATKTELAQTKTQLAQDIENTAMAVMDIVEDKTCMSVTVNNITETNITMSTTVVVM